MRKLTSHAGIAAPMLVDNVDTDQIIPSREMNRVSRDGLGDGLFALARYRYERGSKAGEREDFILNQADYAGASILLAGANFGCGSSREHAVWALTDFGFRVIIAAGFGRIFQRNCARNGLLAAELDRSDIARIAAQVAESPRERHVRIDLGKCEIHAPDGDVYEFAVAEFTAGDRGARPWAYLS
jgi:3-isopropylmalate/(R)-2-methylmalate dehydratase small subunit